MISEEILNKIGIIRGTSTFLESNGRCSRDVMIDVMEEGVIGDESIGGLLSRCG